MGQQFDTPDNTQKHSALSLASLLPFSHQSMLDSALCSELLGDMYHAVFGGLSEPSASRIRRGIAPAKHYKTAANYLHDHPQIRDHILGIWETWCGSPQWQNFSIRIRSILDNTAFDTAGTPEQVADLTAWLYRCAGSENIHDRTELLATLSLLACTIGAWPKSAPLCLPRDSLIFSGVSNGVQLSQESAILELVRHAEEQSDYLEVIRLLTRLIDENICRRSNVGEYHYRISCCWGHLAEETNDPGQMQAYAAQARHALSEACCNDHPQALLCAAEAALAAHELTKCYNYCVRIAEVAPFTQTGGDACWILYRLGKEDFVPLAWQDAAAGYLKLASQYGHPEAARKYREENAVSLSEQLPRSHDSSTGIFCINTENEYARILLATKPDTWLQSSDSMTEAPKDMLTRKYFFLDNDYSSNLRQALRLLQSIKNSGAERTNIDIYLRALEEQAAPLIDTALSCLGDQVVPVHILDDDRLCARVLGLHPLYYPIRNLPDNSAAYLDFVVIGDSRCCEWLVREAFWMTTFRNRQIIPRITVLAPDAAGMVDRLILHCPAMADARKTPDQRSGDPLSKNFPLIDAMNCDYESRTFRNELSRLLASRNVYIAVDTGTDLQNMEMATFLREQSIRTAVKSGALQPDGLPVITFRCTDTDIASLSRRTVVLNENSGNLWYNNYNLIPFGVMGEQYSWDALTHDLIGQLSLDIHMVYCGIDPLQDRNRPEWTSARNSYYQRSYNRDSSIAVALSLGYRLYQCRHSDGGRVLPPFWDILDRDAIFSDQGLNQLARKLGTRLQTDDTFHWTSPDGKRHSIIQEGSCAAETRDMAQWEHDRWNRFMISRGWDCASIEQMRTYRKAGNLRQQLYIGRLHPCICPYEALEQLERELNKDFRNTDIQNIRMTGPILTRQWTQPQRQLERSREMHIRTRI